MKAKANRIEKYFDPPACARRDARDDETLVPHSESGPGDTQLESDLADILDGYLQKLESGTPVSVEELVGLYPQYEDSLREYVDGLSLLNAGVAEMSDSPFRFDHGEHRIVGDFELIREIGRGGMGVVYEARQISLGRRVALKVLPFASMLDQRQISRFETEARAAARLQHSHIVPVYGVGCERGVHYYAMQFIEGSSVREWIDESLEGGTTVKPRRAVRLAAQAAGALHSAHQCGVVHRDIKPSNLLLDSKGELWIADFGLARSQTDSEVTRSGDVLGTLHYMSPEQARGNSSIADPRSDIYSLGVTLFEMLSLQRPFDGESHSEILRQIELGQVKSLRSLNAGVPRDLENVVAKAMSVDPNERYQTAAEFDEDLGRFLDGRATLAVRPSVLRRVTRWCGRHRSVAASMVAVLLIALVAFASTTCWLAGERAELDQRLHQTENTFEKFGLATAERLKQIPGSASARKELLGELLMHYEDLLRVSGDASVREDRAVTSTKIADIHREMGDLPNALRAYRNAEADFLAIGDDASQAMLSKCRSNMSVVMLELGEVSEAAKLARQAIVCQSRLVANAPTSTLMMDLSASYINLASVEFCLKGVSIAELKRAEEIAQRALRNAKPQEKVDVLHTLASIYGRLSTQLVASEVDEAIGFARKAQQCSRAMVAFGGDSVQKAARRLHALNCNNLALLVFQQGNVQDAIKLYQTAATELELVNDRVGLVTALGNLAKAQNKNGDALGAAGTYVKATTVQTSLLMESPGDLNHVSRLGGLYNNHGLALRRLGKADHASVAYEAAVEYQHRAWRLAPKRLTYYRDALSRTLFNASLAAIDAGKPSVAVEFHVRRADLWPRDPKQLLSVAWGVAAATELMPENDPQRKVCVEKATGQLEAALRHDRASSLDEARVQTLARYLRNADSPRGNGLREDGSHR